MSLESDDDLEIVGYFAGDGCQASMRLDGSKQGRKENGNRGLPEIELAGVLRLVMRKRQTCWAVR